MDRGFFYGKNLFAFYGRHLALLPRLFATKAAFAQFVLKHGVIRCASPSEFIPRDDVPDIDEQE
jgi:hypothetical protein